MGRDFDHSSSNFRELLNLVIALEEGVASGLMVDMEVFIFTDISTEEGCFYRGNYPSRPLFNLVLRLRLLEMTGQSKLHMVYISGSRIIMQGADGLLLGDLTSGVMVGVPMLHFALLDKDVIERSSTLLPWIQSWCLDQGIIPLSPEGWFSTWHGVEGGSFS